MKTQKILKDISNIISLLDKNVVMLKHITTSEKHIKLLEEKFNKSMEEILKEKEQTLKDLKTFMKYVQASKVTKILEKIEENLKVCYRNIQKN